MAGEFCPRAAQAAGDADILFVQSPVLCKSSSDSDRSVMSLSQDSAFGSQDGDAEEPPGAEDGSGTEHTELPQVPDPAGHRQGEAAALLEQSEPCPRDGMAEESRDASAARNKQQRALGGFVGACFGSHPLLTLLLLVLLLLLALALGLALAVQSGGGHREAPVTPVTPVVHDTPLLLACPQGWVGYRGRCYFLSRDQGTWDQAQARCSELGASLAVPRDEEMEFLFNFSWITDHWLGLRRRGQGLLCVDGSSFNSSVPVLGNADCVYLAENKLSSTFCSNPMPFICSRAQTVLQRDGQSTKSPARGCPSSATASALL